MAKPSVPPSAPRIAVLEAVREGCSTVNALAARLGVTDNAVRLHLGALERDGHVVRRGTRHSGLPGQPASEYDVTPDGELALSRAYPAAFTALVRALSDRLESRALRAILADAGRRLSDETGAPSSGSLPERAKSCVALLASLGGSATVETGRREAVISAAGCPLAEAVRSAPATCTLVEALLERHANVNAEQECEHGDRPRCRFRITAATHA